MKRSQVVLFIAATIAVFAAPSTSIGARIERMQHPAPAAVDNLRDQIVELSSQVPPELSSYALLRLVELGAITKTNEKRSALLSAFSLAAQSPYPIRRTLIYGNMDSRSGYAAAAMNLKLDTLSLRSEIVVAMLKFDRPLARQLFAEMGPPAIPPLTCSDPLIADPSPYFETAAQIYKRGFSPSVRATDADIDFLDNVLFAVSSGSELHAAMSLLSTLKLSPAARRRASTSLAHGINQIDGDPRTFSATVNQFTEDLTTNDAPGDIGESALLTAAREYIVSQSTAGVCIDEIHRPPPGTGGSSSPTLFSANPGGFAALNRHLAAYGISPITTGDLVPQTIINQKEDIGSLFWQDPTSKNMEDMFKALRDTIDSGDGGSENWQNRATRFLHQMRDWPEPPNQDGAERVLFEKALLYSGFIDAIPRDSPQLEPALVDYIGFLSQPPPKATDEIFILSSINHFFLSRKATADSPEFLQAIASAMQTVPNPSVSVWAALLKLGKISRTGY